jgi:hypothetical protein
MGKFGFVSSPVNFFYVLYKKEKKVYGTIGLRCLLTGLLANPEVI